eukprot:983278-Amphidinium_carterae.1
MADSTEAQLTPLRRMDRHQLEQLVCQFDRAYDQHVKQIESLQEQKEALQVVIGRQQDVIDRQRAQLEGSHPHGVWAGVRFQSGVSALPKNSMGTF